MTHPCIRRVACTRCEGRVEPWGPFTALHRGYCLVCYDWRRERWREALEWAVYRATAMMHGEWRTEDERDERPRQTLLTETS